MKNRKSNIHDNRMKTIGKFAVPQIGTPEGSLFEEVTFGTYPQLISTLDNTYDTCKNEIVGRSCHLMKFREVENLIKKDGWEFDYAVGSHYFYKHPKKPGKVTIPYHNKDFKTKTVNSILKQAGLK